MLDNPNPNTCPARNQSTDASHHWHYTGMGHGVENKKDSIHTWEHRCCHCGQRAWFEYIYNQSGGDCNNDA